jgi:hypothetical protein
VSHALTDTLAEAQALIAAIDARQGYPRDGTTTHAVPIAHPTVAVWAVALDGLDLGTYADELDGLQVVERLDPDWFPGGYP